MARFEEKSPDDYRPQQAIEALQACIHTGVFKMAFIRNASLTSHAAAREVGEGTATRSVARAAGQAVATAHVPIHALGAANYALQAIHRATNPSDLEDKKLSLSLFALGIMQPETGKKLICLL